MSDQKPRWPQCQQLEGTCLLSGAKNSLGSEMYEAFTAFVLGDEPGGRLVLERTAESFTLNITDSVRRGSQGPVDTNALRAMLRRLDSEQVSAP